MVKGEKTPEGMNRSQAIKFFYRQACLPNQLSDKAGAKFVVLGSRECMVVTGLDHHHMRSPLTCHSSARSTKFLYRFGS